MKQNSMRETKNKFKDSKTPHTSILNPMILDEPENELNDNQILEHLIRIDESGDLQ